LVLESKGDLKTGNVYKQIDRAVEKGYLRKEKGRRQGKVMVFCEVTPFGFSLLKALEGK